MTAQELLAHLETLPHSQRVSMMVDLGRRGDPEAREIIETLEHAGFYERMLALYTCYTSRDASHITRSLNDTSYALRGLAARLLPTIEDEVAIQDALRSIPALARPIAVARLRQRGRMAAVDAFLDWLRTESPAQALQLMSFASNDYVRSHQSDLTPEPGALHWPRLARMHPEEMVETLLTWTRTGEAASIGVHQIAQRVLSSLVTKLPDRALEVVAAFTKLDPPKYMNSPELTRKRPQAVVDILLQERKLPYVNLKTVVAQLRLDQITSLAEGSPRLLGGGTSWFKKVSPTMRAQIISEHESLLRTGAYLQWFIVALLPLPWRHDYARKYVSSESLNEQSKLGYAGYLPWDETLRTANESLHAGDFKIRIVALQAIITSARFQPSRLGDLLKLLKERRTEQDPIRRAIFEHLGKVPLGAWRQEHLDDLAELISHGLNDVGLSQITQQHMLTLLLRLLGPHTEWASDQVLRVLRERGWVKVKVKLTDIPSAACEHLAQLLLPLLEEWLAQGKDSATLDVCTMLAERPTAFAKLAPMLEALVRRATTQHTTDRALKLLATAAWPTFTGLAESLTREHPSWITFSPISRYLLRHHQEMLMPYMSCEPLTGRWGTLRAPYILPLMTPFIAGTPRQQLELAQALHGLAVDEKQNASMLAQVIPMLARLPAVEESPLLSLAQDERTVPRTLALFALAHLDTNAGLPVLLEALQDSRARIAILAIRSLLPTMPPEEALATLTAIPLNRVTVAKEVMRLIGDQRSDAAFNALMGLESQPLHRDVRIALLRALDDYESRTETWEAMERAATSDDVDVATTALEIRQIAITKSGARMNRATWEKMLHLVGLLLDHPHKEVRLAALEYLSRVRYTGSLPSPAEQHGILKHTIELTKSPSWKEAKAAGSALFGLATSLDIKEITEMVKETLPNRRLLDHIVNALKSSAPDNEKRLLPVVSATLDVLAQDPLTVNVRISLAVATLPRDTLATYLKHAVTRKDFNAEALARACAALDQLTSRFSLTDHALLESSLRASKDERVRRMAFALLQRQVRIKQSWTDEYLVRLREFRLDSSPLVAGLAQFTLPDEEFDTP